MQRTEGGAVRSLQPGKALGFLNENQFAFLKDSTSLTLEGEEEGGMSVATTRKNRKKSIPFMTRRVNAKQSGDLGQRKPWLHSTQRKE